MQCVDLDYCEDISVEKERPGYFFWLHGLRGSSCYSEGLKIWLFLCHSEWSLVRKSFLLFLTGQRGLPGRWYSHLRRCILLLLNFLSSSSGTFPCSLLLEPFICLTPSATSLPNLVFQPSSFLFR